MKRTPKAALLSLPGHAAAAGSPQPILRWLEQGARRFRDAPAVEGLARAPLTHAGLFRHVRDTAAALRAHGLGRGDVVILCLPNGPEALTALLAVAAVAVALPVAVDEPAEGVAQLAQRLRIRAALFDGARGMPRPLRGLKEITPLPVRIDTRLAAGCFALPATPSRTRRAAAARVDDAAILARTAGTTAEARIIAWSQASLHRSAAAAADWMALTAEDRSLCMMPFVHLHALVRSTMPGLLAGGAVLCMPGFDRARVFDWMRALRPTYMTAVPGIYRGMLAEAERAGGAPGGMALRFLASGSDAIDDQTVAALGRVFGVPVREFYGMSEVAPMLAGTAPGETARASGAIGVPLEDWTLEFRDADARPLPPGEEGEIAARGGLFNPVVGDAGGGSGRIVDGWYLTGDRGFLDDRGRVHVTGRTDDRINRGGKKIAPHAVEAALAGHPQVREAVVFPIPDEVLGESVGALVVPRPGCTPEEVALRSYLADRLADYMVPGRIAIVDAIPRSAVGKISRKALAAQFDLRAPAAPHTPAAPEPAAAETETALLGLVRSFLGREDIGPVDDFKAVGGDSFFATTLLVGIEERFGILLTPGQYIENSNVRSLARLLDRLAGGAQQALIVRVQEGKGGVPLFFAHAPRGYAWYAHVFGRELGAQQAVYAFQSSADGARSEPLEAYAARYVQAMRAIQPGGPYCLAGHSFGAQLAFEVAQQLAAAGAEVAFLALIDDEADLFKRKFGLVNEVPTDETFAICKHMLDGYIPEPYPGDADVFIAVDAPIERAADPAMGWSDLVMGELGVHNVPGTHSNMMSDAGITQWSALFAARMAAGLERSARRCADRRNPDERRARAEARRARPDVAAAMAARRAGRRGDLGAEIGAYRRAIEHNADQPYWIYRNLGNALLQGGEPDAALAALRASIERERIPVAGWLELARALHGMGRGGETREAIAAAERCGADLAYALPEVAAAWLAAGDPAATERCARRALELDPANPGALVQLGRAAEARGDLDEAVRTVCSAIELAPDNAGAVHRLGALLARRGDIEGAEKAQRRCIQIEPRHVGAHRELSVLLERLGRQDEAGEALRRAAELAPENTDSLRRLGVLLRRRGALAEAEAAFRRVLARTPEDASAHRELALTIERQGRDAEAIDVLRRAIALAPDDAVAYEQLGVLLRRAEDPAGAEAALRRALEIDPDSFVAARELGAVLEAQERHAEAVPAWQRAAELAPGRAGPYTRLGGIHARLGNLPAAEAALRRALEIEPGLAGVRRELSIVLEGQKRMDEAVLEMRRAAAAAPDRAGFFHRLGVLLCKLGNLDDARAAFGRVLELDPQHAGALRQLQGLDAAQGVGMQEQS